MHGTDYIRDVFLPTFRSYYRLGGEIALSLYPLVNYLLDSTGMKQSMHGDRAGLTTPIGASTGLILNCRIPFQVVVDHMVGSGDIQACSGGLRIQYQSRGGHHCSKTIDTRLAIRNRRPTVNHVTGHAVAATNVFVKNVGHLRVRSKDQYFLSVRKNLIEDLKQTSVLRAVCRRIFRAA